MRYYDNYEFVCVCVCVGLHTLEHAAYINMINI